MKIGDIYKWKFRKKDDFVITPRVNEMNKMFDFWKKKNTTELKPANKEEELMFLKARNVHAEKKLEIERMLSKEKEKARDLKKEGFSNTTAGKILSGIGKAREELQKFQGSKRPPLRLA